ncbi:MAG TPA: LysR family transcriptional regulator [Solirubrobacteraceae bacterium]|nr:LysR family transcriptional regulator [Solirubrobacteraceae bacterium]
MAVTVTQLVAFLTVVRRGSVRAAAEELVVTQPSVSAAIAALEREVGVSLMARSGRHLAPTPAGEAYAAYAADVLGLLERGARTAREIGGEHRSTLRLGAVTTAGEHLVAPLLRTFREAYPDLQITLQVGNRREVFQQLVDHRVDVAITGRLPEDLPIEGRPFAENDFVLVTAPGDQLAKARAVDVGELAERRWLLREPGSGTRTLVEEYLAAHGLHPEVLTLGSNGAIKQAVALGLGLALQPHCAVQMELELGRLATVRVRGGLPLRHWYVVRSAVGPVRKEVKAFMEYAESRAAAQALAGAGAATG